MTIEQILSPSRRSDIVAVRQVLMYKMRLAGMTYANIGRALNRDHSTVIHGIRRVEGLIEVKDKLIMELI